MKVLIVSTFPTMVRILRGLLEDLGIREIDDASNSITALAKVGAGRLGLVLADWFLEPESGLELLKAIRADAVHARLPCIVMFSNSSSEKIEDAMAAGATSYLVKPFDAATLRSAIERALAAAV